MAQLFRLTVAGAKVAFVLGLSIVLASLCGVLIPFIQYHIRIFEAQSADPNFSMSTIVQRANLEAQLERAMTLTDIGQSESDTRDTISRFFALKDDYAKYRQTTSYILCSRVFQEPVLPQDSDPMSLDGYNKQIEINTISFNKCNSDIFNEYSDERIIQIARLRSLESKVTVQTAPEYIAEILRVDSNILNKVSIKSALDIFNFVTTDHILKMSKLNFDAIDNVKTQCIDFFNSFGTMATLRRDAYSFSNASYLWSRPLCIGFTSTLLNTVVPQSQSANQSQGQTQAVATYVPRDISWQMITYYRFFGEKLKFEKLSFYMPLELSLILLVYFSGALGGVFRYSFELYKLNSQANTDAKKYEFLRRVSMIDILIRMQVGITCAIVIYVMSRISLLAVIDKPPGNSATPINPFVIAFLAVASGAFLDEAFKKISMGAQNEPGK